MRRFCAKALLVAVGVASICMVLGGVQKLLWYRDGWRLEKELDELTVRFNSRECMFSDREDFQGLQAVRVTRAPLEPMPVAGPPTPFAMNGRRFEFRPSAGLRLKRCVTSNRASPARIVFDEGGAIHLLGADPVEAFGFLSEGEEGAEAWKSYLDMWDMRPAVVRNAIWLPELREWSPKALRMLRFKVRYWPGPASMGITVYEYAGGDVLAMGTESIFDSNPREGYIMFHRFIPESGTVIAAEVSPASVMSGGFPDGPYPEDYPDMETLASAMLCIRGVVKTQQSKPRK